MTRVRFRHFASLALSLALIVGVSVPTTASAATPLDRVAAQVTKALSAKRVCTPAQATRKAAGKRVNCVVKSPVCKKRVNGKVVRVKCRTRRAVTPRLTPSTGATKSTTKQLMFIRSYIDEGGVNDAPGQKDLTAMSSDSTATQLMLTVNWDITSTSGSNTADGCFLFDSDGDGNANVAICVTWGGTPGTLQAVRKYTCNDTALDRCAGAGSATTLSTGTCTLVTNAADPFGSASDAPNTDAKASCTILFTTIVSSGAPSTLTNTCSYPSQQPNSAPSDCLLIPRDGFLTLAKTLVGAPAGYTGPFDLAYRCTKNDSTTITGIETVAGGTSSKIGMVAGYRCAVTETPPAAPAGYAWSGSPTYSAPVTITQGQNSTLTVTNTLVELPGTLIVKKVVINDNGGTKVASNFSFQVGTATPTPFEADGQNDLTRAAGTYTITESAAPGYTTTYSGCSNVVLPRGGTATCTITNDDQPATLVVKKVVKNDNGGTKVAADFSFQVGAGAPTAFEADGQNDLTVNAGTYSVSEPAAAGYTTTYSGCSNVVLANGGTATCTITNDDQPGTLIVEKVMDNKYGGTLQPQDFGFSLNGSSATQFDADGSNTLTVDAGTYSITEDPGAKYTATYDGCDTVAIANGETVTCTITNHDKPVTIVVEKVVINNDRGTTTADGFHFKVDGGSPTAFTPDSPDGLHATNTVTNLAVGDHTVTEVDAPGYTTTYGDGCTTVGATNGDTITCVITNNDQPATLTVKKILKTDNGSTAQVTDFSFAISDGTDSLPKAFNAQGEVSTALPAGTYTVTEDAAPGFDVTYDGCTDIVLTNGGSATCTITNDDQPGTLIVQKSVINDDGGTKTAADFSFTVNGGAAVAFEADGANDVIVDKGAYTVREIADPGYTTTYSAGCTDNAINNGGEGLCVITNDDKPATLTVKKVLKTDSGSTATVGDFSFTVNGGAPVPLGTGTVSQTVDAGTYNVVETAATGFDTTYDGCADIVLTNGGSATCTITNDDQPATLIVKKIVINDNGGTKAPADFSFAVNGGPSTGFQADGRNDLTVDAGTYNVLETADTGYTTTYDGCADLTLANGATATCTITNNDKPGALVITKVVVNDDGGTAAATDFSYSVDGAAPVAFGETAGADHGTSGTIALDAGDHTVTEPATAGYAATNGCANIAIANGATTTCTITNNDIAPKLALVKVVDNGVNGTAGAAAFTLSATSPDGPDIERAGNITTPVDVFAGVTYQLSETGPAGYDPAGGWVCTNTDPQSGAENWSQDGSALSLQVGANVTCTITNRMRDLAITKSTQEGPFVPGDTINYTVVVTNLGTATIPSNEITVSDPMLGNGLVLQGDAVALEPGQSRTYTGSRAVTSRDCGVIVNTATVAIPRDAFLANNAQTVRSTVNCTGDLALVKGADKATYTPGQTITYTLTVTNVGTSIVPVAQITVSDPALSNLTPAAESPTELSPDQSITYIGTKVATKAMCGKVPNTASVSYEGDSNSENNTSSVTVTVAGGSCIIIEGPKPTTLRIVKTGPANAKHGRNVGYRLTVTNTGKQPSVNTLISDALPKGMTLSALPKGATISKGVVTWKLGTLQPGQSRTVTIVLRSAGTKALRRCNIGAARADNASRVSDPACTNFTVVAGARIPGVTG